MKAFKGVRKPMPPSTKIIMNPKDENKNRRWDWRSALDSDNNDDMYQWAKG